MFATLGNDIIFDALISPESLTDQRETKYSEIALINGKPGLQRIGEALIKFSMSIHFHVDFCNPEDEYAKLNAARIAGTILPFVYGNGFNEGDFVITNLDRTINNSDAKGNLVDITCSLSLLEYAGTDAAARQIEQDKKNAFAISSNRPLPSTPQLQLDNPALLVSEENTKAMQSVSNADAATNEVNKAVGIVNTGVIDKAQKFVDQINEYTTIMNTQLTEVSASVAAINATTAAFTSLTTIAPNLSAKISLVQGSVSAMQAQLTLLAGLPNPITTTPDGTNALNELTNTLLIIKALKDNTKAMNDANAPIVAALATKKPIT